MDSFELAKKARKSISSFCINECSAYCCRKGFLIVTKKELDLINLIKKEDMKFLVKKLENGAFSLYLGYSKFPCPSLTKEFTCGIHTKKGRPQVCKDFPLFIKDKTVFLSNRCFAVQRNLFFSYIKQFENMGFKLHKYSDLEALDVFKIL
ncbi:MAG: YkgJ family cysteine cluster protein [archaeon]